ncbi:hypothetical protein [Actinoplanes sp. NPDC089786]|uniref:hypothetical protein n=1 Tax=Actinoplanes sp. NPDC089786 TaxID=3155185 RepID=UPI00342D2BB6
MTSPTSPAAADVVRDEATAWRHLTHALGVELRRRLIPLVRGRLFDLDLACRVLNAAGLPPLPHMWTVQLTVNLRRRVSSTSMDRAVAAYRDDLDQAVCQALGPATTVRFYQPPQGRGTGGRHESGNRNYDLWGQPTVMATVRAETSYTAETKTVDTLLAALADLPGATADLDTTTRVHVEPDQETPVELDVDTDAPHRPYTPPPGFGPGSSIEARTARRLAMEAWQHLVRQIRSELIDALIVGDIDEQPGRNAPYGVVDDLLRDLGLPGLPHAHLYEIATAIPVTLTADSPAAARRAAYRMLRDASPTFPQCGLPITVSSRFRDPDIVAADADSYRVTWRETYLVCLRGTHSPRLAEHAVRLQVSVLAEQVPDIAGVPLVTVYLGEYIDHRLDPDRD